MARPTIDPDSKTIRFDMVLSEAQMERVDDWRFANRVRTRADAFRRLIDMALEVESANQRYADALEKFNQRLAERTRQIAS